MKKYIWGRYQGKEYSILEISQSYKQIIIRPVGVKNTHLTLHKLNIEKETDQHWLVKYQNSSLKLFKSSYAPISFNWTSPAIRGVWSNARVAVAKNCGFLDPEKHATSSQGLLIKFENTKGYNIGAIRIELNDSSNKSKYLKDVDKIGEIVLSNTEFMIRIILSTPENEYRGKSNFSFETNLGKLFIIIEKNKV